MFTDKKRNGGATAEDKTTLPNLRIFYKIILIDLSMVKTTSSAGDVL
jgi:hypothetical protein